MEALFGEFAKLVGDGTGKSQRDLDLDDFLDLTAEVAVRWSGGS